VDSPDAHSSNFNVIGRRGTSFAHFGLLFINRILDLPAELRILVEVGEMRPCNVYLLILVLLILLNLLLFDAGGRVVVVLLSQELQLSLGVVLLLQ
jgi:hypothetical protein